MLEVSEKRGPRPAQGLAPYRRPAEGHAEQDHKRVARALDAPHDPKVLVVTRCADYPRGWRGGVTYLTKGVPTELWDKLKIPIGLRKKARESLGPVRGKRMGMSRSIGPAARRWAAMSAPRK